MITTDLSLTFRSLIIFFLIALCFINPTSAQTYEEIEERVGTLYRQGEMTEMTDLILDNYERFLQDTTNYRPQDVGYLLTTLIQGLSEFRQFDRIVEIFDSDIKKFLEFHSEDAPFYSLYIRVFSAYPISLRDLDFAIQILSNMEDELSSEVYTDNDRLFFYNEQGKVLGRYSESFSQSIESYHKALSFKNSADIDTAQLATTYGSLADHLYRRGDITGAIDNHLLAIDIRKSDSTLNRYLAISYNNLGSIFLEIGDFAKAADNYSSAYGLIQKGTELSKNHALYMRNYGMAKERLGDLEEAERALMLTDSIESLLMEENDPIRGITINRIAKTNYLAGNLKIAEDFSKKAITIFSNNSSKEQYSESLIGSYFTLASCAFDNKDSTQFNKAVFNLSQNIFLTHFDSLLLSYLELKQVARMNNHEYAQELADGILSKSFPKRYAFNYSDLRLSTVKLLLSRELISMSDEKFAEYLLSTIDVLMPELYAHVNSKIYWEDKLNVSDIYLDIFQRAIDACYVFYNKFGDQVYFDNAVKLISFSKNKQIRGRLFESTSIEGNNQEIQKLKRLFAFYQDRKMAATVEDQIQLYTDQLLAVSNKLLKYNIDTDEDQIELDLHVEPINQIDHCPLISYFVTDSSFYTISISDSSYFIKNNNVRELNTLSQEVIEMLSDPSTTIDAVTLDQYSKLVLGPLYFKHDVTSLSVSPDGILSLIPFEALLSSTKEMLIKNLSIYYVDLYLPDVKPATQDLQYEYLGIAPEFETLASLPFAKEEVAYGQQIFKENLIINDSISKVKFYNIAGKSKILHLATHSLYNQASLFDSRIVLGEQNEQSISLREVAELNLPNSLVIANSCDSGNGDLISSDGVLSLSSAFMMAGADQVITSLWKSNDYVGSLVIKEFLKTYKNNTSAHEALRSSKLSFLKTNKRPELNHPFYWTNLRITGRPLNNNNSIAKYSQMFIGLFTFLFLSIFLVYKLKG